MRSASRVLLLWAAMAILLSACTQPGQRGPTDPTQAETVTQTEPAPTLTPTEGSAPTEVTPTQPQQTEPASTDAAPTEPAPTQPVPTEPDPAPTQAKPTQPAPTQPAPTQPKPTQPKPATPGRPTSSATCKDTGSNEIWPDPSTGGKDYYEEEDPERISYLQDLMQNGDASYFWIKEPYMRMYLGRTYGIPLFTSFDIAAECVWTSSDPTVATVNHVGFVVPLREGEVIITVTHGDQSRQCPVTVVKETDAPTFAYLEARAKDEARLIANDVMNDPALKTDLERIAKAARIVNNYVAAGTYTSWVPGYNQPFGTLVTFYSTCAGSTRAMGLVLEYMGFEWYHQGEDQWNHQWCVVYDVDGQTAFADASEYGIAGYGERREDGSNWVQYKNTTELVKPFY